MIHGQTKIELYNPNTKIKKIYRDDNVFQGSVIAKYLRGLGECTASPYGNNDFRNIKPWTNLVGGLFLFKNAIQEGDSYMSAGNQMIGNGSYGVANNGMPTELGSYNSVESSDSGNAITQVYDFTTDQANGTIGCVCLTSSTGGYIGYGNASGEKTTNSYNFNRNISGNDFKFYETRLSGYSIAYGDFTYEFVTLTGGSMVVRKTTHAITKSSVFNGYSEEKTFDLSVIGNPLNLGDKDRGCMPFYNNGKIAVLVNVQQFVASGENAYFYEFDPTNETLALKTVTNSSGHRFDIGGYYNYWGTISNGIIGNVAHGLLFGRNGDDYSKATVIRISDSVTIGEMSNFSFTDQNDNDYVSEFPSGLTLLKHSNFVSIYDGTNDRIINGNKNLNGLCYDATNDALWYFSNANGLINNPLYLATINNLQSAVTKTAAQTMKVTYTLTEEEPE